MKITATAVVACAVADQKVQPQYWKEGSGQVPGDFQADWSGLSSKDQILYRHNTLVYTAASLWWGKNWQKRQDDSPPHPILLNIAPIDLFLYRRVKAELAGLLLSQDRFRTKCAGVIRTKFAEPFRWWMHR
jgi:hypothetical protein